VNREARSVKVGCAARLDELILDGGVTLDTHATHASTHEGTAELYYVTLLLIDYLRRETQADQERFEYIRTGRAFIPLSSKPLPRKHTWARSKYRIPIFKKFQELLHRERERGTSRTAIQTGIQPGPAEGPVAKRCVRIVRCCDGLRGWNVCSRVVVVNITLACVCVKKNEFAEE
jgi:hypothetical protein